MSDPRPLKIHVFGNGAAIFELPGEHDPKFLENFREAYNASPEEALMIAGFEVEVIEHYNPLTTLRPRINVDDTKRRKGSRALP